MPKSIGNKTCWQKTGRKYQPAERSRQRCCRREKALTDVGTFTSGISPTNTHFRPPADYTPASAGRILQSSLQGLLIILSANTFPPDLTGQYPSGQCSPSFFFLIFVESFSAYFFTNTVSVSCTQPEPFSCNPLNILIRIYILCFIINLHCPIFLVLQILLSVFVSLPYTSSCVFIPCRCTVIAANNTTTVTATASIAFLCIFFPPDFFLITICQICRQNFADFLEKKTNF